MSFSSEEEVDCPCGETFPARLWNAVNLKEDPDLRSVLAGGELNVVSCPACKSLVFTDRFVLVHDPDAQLLAFVHPRAREAEREYLEACMHRDAGQAQAVEGGMNLPYPPSLFFGLDALVSAMEREQESNDQADIVAALSVSVDVELRKLSPSHARAAGLPRVIPLAGAGEPLVRLAAGLRAVLAANDRLSVCADLLRRVEAGGLLAGALEGL